MMKRHKVALVLIILCLAAFWGVKTYAGTFLDSPHGNATSGVERDPAEGFPVGHCQHCHDPHAGPTSGITGGPYGYNLFNPITDNSICYTNTGVGSGCHQGLPSTYPAQEGDRMPGTETYPHYFERNSAGTKTTGVDNRSRWPGQAVYNDTGQDAATLKYYSPHYMDVDMPELDSANRGLCKNCHDPHGTTNPFDMLTNTYIDPGPNSNYQLCFDCHSATGPVGMDTENTLIEGFYNQSPNGGHRIKCSAKAVTGACPPAGITVGDKMPCYNCHNPHGSRGNDGLNPNTNLISDQRSGWSGLTDTLNTASQVRSFCLGCHVPSDGTPGSITVMGISMNTIPAVSGAHESSATASCHSCHGSSYTVATDTNVHNPDPGGTCLTCHQNQQVGSTYTRRAITVEFGLAWGHKNSGKVGTYPLTEADCAVCHMEANSTSNPTPGALHANEAVDLRDPDTGTQIQYLGADYSFGQFTRNTNSSTLETWTTVVQNQQCLKCHDTDGALSTEAQVPTTGTSADPWGTGASVVDVDAMFATTNSTFHPVKGAQNNSYADIDTMVSPWNQYSKTPGTPSAGDLISCFDCHNAPSPLATGTVAAHGDDVTLRASLQYNVSVGSVEGVATSLCSICHAPAVYESGSAGLSAFGGTDTGLSSSGSRYIPGATDSAMHANRMDFPCMSCHGSSWLDPGRPRRAEDVHGFDTMVGGATTWGTEPDTGQPGARPYAFLRNNDVKGEQKGDQAVWDGWRPRFDGATDNTANGWGCSWTVDGSVSPCSRSDHSNLWLSYGPGGTY